MDLSADICMAVSFGSFSSLLKCHFLREATLGGEEVPAPHHNLSQLYVTAGITILMACPPTLSAMRVMKLSVSFTIGPPRI